MIELPDAPPVHTRWERYALPAVVVLAALLAGLLARRVLASLAAGADPDTLARALPGPVANVVARYSGAPFLPSMLVAMVPLGVRVACGALGALVGATGATGGRHDGARRAQVVAWLASACIAAVALATGVSGVKQGMAALGYALAWPAVASIVAVVWAGRWPRATALAAITLLTLAGLTVRALPVGWPGENSLSWWAMLPHTPRLAAVVAVLMVIAAVAAATVAGSSRRALPTAVRLLLATLASALLLCALPAFEHYGPEKHPAALASEINTSYYQVALTITDRAAFVRGHVGRMPSLPMHARTHPPGWPLLFRAACDAARLPAMARMAESCAWLLGADAGRAATLAAGVAERALPGADAAGLWLLVALAALSVIALPVATWFAARATMANDPAVLAAAWVALLPAPLLYFPNVDVVYPTCYAITVGSWLRRARHAGWSLLAGLMLAVLAALSFGNLALLLALGAITLLGWRGEAASRAHEPRAWALLLLPLAILAAIATWAGAPPVQMLMQAMAQHREILAHRTPALWILLNPLETALALGVPTVLWLARELDWRAIGARARRASLAGGELLFSPALAAVLILELSGTTKGESGRLWMGWFPLLLAGAAPGLATRERDWPRLALLLGLTLVVLKGFYVYVWLYRLA